MVLWHEFSVVLRHQSGMILVPNWHGSDTNLVCPSGTNLVWFSDPNLVWFSDFNLAWLSGTNLVWKLTYAEVFHPG